MDSCRIGWATQLRGSASIASACWASCGVGGPVADEDAVPAALVGRLDDEVAQVGEHEPALVVVDAAVGRHAGDQRLLPAVVADQVGYPRVDDLVVGDARAGSVGDRDLARLPRPHQTGDAERRVGPEHLRVEEQVVDAPVDHVDRFETVDRAHVHPIVVVDDQVAALDERRAHALGEERVLEVRRVEDPRGEHGDRRVAHPVGGERAEQAVELVGVGVDRLDALAGEHLGEARAW